MKRQHENSIIQYHYLHYSLDDISLFEQYLVISHNITPKSSPDATLLSFFQYNNDKPKYHNVRCSKDNSYEIFDGTQWIPGSKYITKNITSRIRALIRSIFHKFKFFLTSDCIRYVTNYIERSKPGKKGYSVINTNLNKFIGKSSPSDRDYKIPKSKKSPLLSSIIDDFTWKTVSAYIERMESINIKFDAEAQIIRAAILAHVERSDYDTRIFFKKLHDRIFTVIWENTCKDEDMDPEEIKQNPIYFQFYQSELSVC